MCCAPQRRWAAVLQRTKLLRCKVPLSRNVAIKTPRKMLSGDRLAGQVVLPARQLCLIRGSAGPDIARAPTIAKAARVRSPSRRNSITCTYNKGLRGIRTVSVYLHDIPLDQAQARFQQALQVAGLWHVLGLETLVLDEKALGRILATPIWASISSPNYHAAAMDGFALRAADTAGAKPTAPMLLVLGKGSRLPVAATAKYVDTGDPLPDWADAVVPIENVEALDGAGRPAGDIRDPTAIRVRAAVAPWSHVRPMGEDIVATQLVLPAGRALRPADLGAIAAAGHQSLVVARKPRVAIIPTGTELVPIGSRLKAGEILEYNSIVLAAQVAEMGAEPTRLPTVADDIRLIAAAVRAAAWDFDLILLNAGSSAGAEDFSARVVEELGQLLVHGVAVRPGHPVILGMIRVEDNVSRGNQDQSAAPQTDAGTSAPRPATIPVIGVPGYPVSAAMTAEIFLEPIIAKWLGRRPKELPIEQAQLTRKITSPAGDDDYVRVAVGRVGDRLLAAPLARGAGVITSLVQADGIVIVPSGTQGAEAGEKVSVRLYRAKRELDNTILCIGSHDLALDVLSQYLSARDRRLVSANVGSQGGLVALRREEAHVAGAHLLDPTTGQYNISSVRQYLPGARVKVVALVRREQGLLVRRGNPKGLAALGDLTRRDLRFVNRQRGAGTRVLLDYQLGAVGISTDSIQGYNEEEYTHLGVAAAIASGRADCGLAIAAAARALDLDFIPLFQERFDLIMPLEHANSHLLAPIYDILRQQDFKDAITRLGGYDVSVMGMVILEDQ
jgi:putative molybdopterin biosynthesis protein